MVTPPSLAWLRSFASSLGVGLYAPPNVDVRSTVNPLLFHVIVTFPDALPEKNVLVVWNLFQKWAAANECVPNGKIECTDRSLVVDVIIKRRFGFPLDEHPATLEKKHEPGRWSG